MAKEWNGVKPVRIGLVGIGKIARDQHIPSIRANSRFDLAACASQHSTVDGAMNFPTIEAMLDGCLDLDAVAICTPPQAHFEAARLALESGKHVLLEKPPCLSVTQLVHLTKLARDADRTLYQTWHSQHAPGVAPAEKWLKGREIRGARVRWMEDVRQWHPGQRWIWRAGGFGVFDPGINAISILTKILPVAFFPTSADLLVPSNCQTPIAANVLFATETNAEIAASFDFRHTGTQTWDIDIETDAGPLKLSAGGANLAVERDAPAATDDALHGEYPSIYSRFADLIAARESEVDVQPFRLVADIFLIANRQSVEPFED